MYFLAAQVSIDWNSFVTGAVGGLAVAVIVLVAESIIRKFEKKSDKRESEIIQFKNQTRTITGSIFTFLAPGASIELMKNDLGSPNRKWMSDPELFFEPERKKKKRESSAGAFYTYLYIFKNAHVKIISRDNESVDALSVLAWEQDISLDSLPVNFSEANRNLNLATITEELFDCAEIHAEHFPGCKDSVTALRTYIGNPFWMYITYFVDTYGKMQKDPFEMDLENDLKQLIGATIQGICLSNQATDTTFAFLYDSPVHT